MVAIEMKVIHILCGKANPQSLNGVNKVVDDLATYQAGCNWDVEVWGLVSNAEINTHDQRAYRLRLFSTRSALLIPHALTQSLDALPSDVTVHFHSVFIPQFYLISRRLAVRGIRWVVTPHGGYGSMVGAWRHSVRNALKRIYFETLERHILQRASAIHVLGRFGDAELLSRFRQKLVAVPNAYAQSAAETSFSWINSDRLVLVYCGRLAIKQKGLDTLLLSLRRIRSRGFEVTLNVVGDGEDAPVLRRKVDELGLVNVVQFHGALYDLDKQKVFDQSDLFVHLSRWEGMPMAVLEAAASKLPLLISERTNLADLVREYACGYVIDDTTEDVVADATAAITRAMECKRNRMLHLLGVRAGSMVVEQLSPEKVFAAINARLYISG